MSENKIEIYEELELPVIPLRGVVGFPAVQLNLEIVRPASLKAFSAAATLHDARVLLIAQKELDKEDPKVEDLYRVGVLAEIKHVVKNPHGNLAVVFEGISRVKLIEARFESGMMIAKVVAKKEKQLNKPNQQCDAMMMDVKRILDELKTVHPTFDEEMKTAAEAIADPGYFADFVASSAIIDYKNKQSVLEMMLPRTRLEKLLVALEEELMLLRCERDIQKQVRAKIDKNQKDYFLREQIKAIQSELGEEEEDDELKYYEEKIDAAKISDEIREKLYKELNKLAKTPFGAAEGTVIRTYLDTCLEFPFGIKSQDKISVAEAKKILDSDHDGLIKVKERILEFVAVKQFSPDVKNQIKSPSKPLRPHVDSAVSPIIIHEILKKCNRNLKIIFTRGRGCDTMEKKLRGE